MNAFAGNSLLCRIALKHTRLDAASFPLTLRLALTSAAILGGIALVVLQRQMTVSAR